MRMPHSSSEVDRDPVRIMHNVSAGTCVIAVTLRCVSSSWLPVVAPDSVTRMLILKQRGAITRIKRSAAEAVCAVDSDASPIRQVGFRVRDAVRIRCPMPNRCSRQRAVLRNSARPASASHPTPREPMSVAWMNPRLGSLRDVSCVALADRALARPSTQNARRGAGGASKSRPQARCAAIAPARLEQ